MISGKLNYRIGGDVFIALSGSLTEEELTAKFARLEKEIALFNQNEKKYAMTLSFSWGGAIYRPGEADFPTYNIGLFGSEDEAKTTYINQLRTSDANYSDNVRTLKDKIKGYNSNKNTYMFQRLIEEGNIKWGTHAIASNVKELIESWIKSQRSKGVIDTRDNFDKTWATYIEYLTAQDQARALNTKGTQRLISETCAIGYNQRKSDKNSGDYAGSEWANGGACYAN